MATQVNVVTDTATLARAMGSSLKVFNTGVHPGTSIRLRQLTGVERVVVQGTTAGAKIVSSESWIEDRFGPLGARQVRRLLESLGVDPDVSSTKEAPQRAHAADAPLKKWAAAKKK